ncbi:hypothetical protein GUITHDRAFT_121599 [Guillardia theta CCMP2712]|uniref:Uncharacterized protein n=1 Tax=Guillardia theta (strain CCMP2712) TaxID=905079 RepID=L1I8N5_GUITC|nr:hypothetical protein GUITHDRAFT_121599 [Guillardia theta CCMP2712]EKX32210.1 hypothetical protein GUITHDRAFT_121599 [Guillardia theta CCMP2712]|eukprot:XP_005819190.1 hypothetical protein GUITHDRAFT_121599 [Guillardia theta CCMP2712]
MPTSLSRCPEDLDISTSHPSAQHVYGEPYGPSRPRVLRSSLKKTDSMSEGTAKNGSDPFYTLQSALSVFSCIPMSQSCSCVSCPIHNEDDGGGSHLQESSAPSKPAMRGMGDQKRRVSFTRYQQILEEQQRCVELRSMNLSFDQEHKLEDALLQAELEKRRKEKKETFDAGVRRLAQRTGCNCRPELFIL